MRRLPALAVTTAALVLLAHPSGAAAKRFHIADLAGDANGVNGQGFGFPVPGQSTAPAQVSGADILGIDVTNRFKGSGKARKPAGFDVVVHLAAPLQQGVLLTLTMNTSVPCGDSSTIQLGAGTSSLAICQSSDPSKAGATVGSAEVDGKDVHWTIDDLFKAGTKIDAFSATTSVFVLGVFDEAGSDAVFTYGK